MRYLYASSPCYFGNVNKNYLPYYRDMSVERKLSCSSAEAGYYFVRSSLVVMQFGEILRGFELPQTWREAIVKRCQIVDNGQDAEQERLQRRRVDLDAEQKRLITAYIKGVELLHNERKLIPGQLADAYDLLRADVPFRQVAQQYSIHPESLRRLALRDGVVLGARGQKLTPTQRKFTPEQRREARVLAQSGISQRQIARQLGISRGAVKGLLRGETQVR